MYFGSFPEKNLEPLDEFEGFFPHEMYGLLYSPFDEDESPMRLNPNLSKEYRSQLKFCSDLVIYLGMVKENEPLKLTQKGNLPRKFCRSLHDSGVRGQELIPLTSDRIYREDDSSYIHITNVLTREWGLTKKRYGRLSLTQKARIFLKPGNESEFYLQHFKKYATEYNCGKRGQVCL